MITDLFEIPADVTYLNCASLSPQLKSVTEAGMQGLKRKSQPWNIQGDDWFTDAETLRALVAQVINSDAEGIAIIPSVSYGISIAAANIRLQKGQQIVVLDQEYPSNYYAWRELAKVKGAEIVTVKKQTTWTEAVIEAINGQTALVAIPNCHWTNGALIDLEEVSKKTRSAGAALVIDASQSMGAHPIDVSVIQPDFLVSVGYKWLMGPYGLGYLYAAPKWREEGRPIEYSWMTKNNSENFATLANYRDDYRPGARRFDMGEFSGFIHIPMAIAALEQVIKWSVPYVQSSLKPIIQHISDSATELGVGHPAAGERSAQMIGLDLPNGVPDLLKKELTDEKIFVAIRGTSIRVSPHLFTQEQDIDRLFKVIARHI